MRFALAIDEFCRDMRSQGRMNSDATERSYRSILDRHCDDVSNRDPRTVGREDIKRTLNRWPKPNTQHVGRAVLVSFYDYAVEEGWIKYNPARQTRRPRKQPPTVYRLTRAECAALLEAVQTERERWTIYLALCAGLRNAELRGLRGEHFQRPGFIWVDASIAKGSRERWLPIIAELAPIVAEIRAARHPDEYVLCAQRWRDAPHNTVRLDLKQRPSSSQALRSTVMRVAQRAGIHAHVHPHLLRHAFCDHVARFAGERMAQQLMGHKDIQTTQLYMGLRTPDGLARALDGLTFRLPPAEPPDSPDEATTGIEPVPISPNAVEPNLLDWLRSQDPKIELYAAHFQEQR